MSFLGCQETLEFIQREGLLLEHSITHLACCKKGEGRQTNKERERERVKMRGFFMTSVPPGGLSDTTQHFPAEKYPSHGLGLHFKRLSLRFPGKGGKRNVQSKIDRQTSPAPLKNERKRDAQLSPFKHISKKGREEREEREREGFKESISQPQHPSIHPGHLSRPIQQKVSITQKARGPTRKPRPKARTPSPDPPPSHTSLSRSLFFLSPFSRLTPRRAFLSLGLCFLSSRPGSKALDFVINTAPLMHQIT